jgi:uncharacterized protein YbbC (DUF1343 family)
MRRKKKMQNSNKVILGIENIDAYLKDFEGKRVGLITNPTGIDSSFESSIDILRRKTNLVGLFSPEHGVRASIQAGMHLDTYIDEETGIPVYSLYGESRHPGKDLMDKLDIFAIDIQDGGSRYYTFIYTMAYCMMSCKEFNKKFVVFDRPNPAGANLVEGTKLVEEKYRSFVGYYSMVQRHGMTIGELAEMFNKEYGIGCDLEVIPMVGYTREMEYEETNLPWVLPSPNFPRVETAYVYNATCLFEGTNVAEGRGTTTPFELFGAPWLKSETLARELNSYHIPGVVFRPQWFTPTFSKYQGELCGGVYVHVTDREKFPAVSTSLILLNHMRTHYGDHFSINKPYTPGRPSLFDFEAGCDEVIKPTMTIEEQLAKLEKDTQEFKEIRKKYLIY